MALDGGLYSGKVQGVSCKVLGWKGIIFEYSWIAGLFRENPGTLMQKSLAEAVRTDLIHWITIRRLRTKWFKI